jgi:hypothetical protein
MTPFYPKRTLSINVAYTRLERELFSRWTLFHSGKEITVKNSEGKEVRFAGDVKFAGSARELFWGGFFEPDFKKIIKEQLDQTVKDCESHRELAKAALNETADLLRRFSRKVYDRMAEIDQRIRGNGDPNMAQRQAVVDRVKALNADIEVLTEAARKQLDPSPRWRWLQLSWSRTPSSVR